MGTVFRMGRPRGFDEQAVTAAAAAMFAGCAYDGLSVDDLVQQLGVHRNSLYKTFGSKRGLYLAALRWYRQHELVPVAERLAACADVAEVVTVARQDRGLDLLLLAAVERAPFDTEVAEAVGEAFALLREALPDAPSELVSTLLGERLRARSLSTV